MAPGRVRLVEKLVESGEWEPVAWEAVELDDVIRVRESGGALLAPERLDGGMQVVVGVPDDAGVLMVERFKLPRHRENRERPKGGEVLHRAEPPLFYIQDNRTMCGNAVFWWMPNGNGYTTHIDRAGKYPIEYVRGLRDTDVPYAVEEVDAIRSQHVDMQHLRNLKPCSQHRDPDGPLLANRAEGPVWPDRWQLVPVPPPKKPRRR